MNTMLHVVITLMTTCNIYACFIFRSHVSLSEFLQWVSCILRKFDLVLMDEASQYVDREFSRYIVCTTEQPHKPFQVVVADFSQLQPFSKSSPSDAKDISLCHHYCKHFPLRVDMKTVYRTSDPEHLLFLNRIRLKQPSREQLEEYFGDRHWKGSRPDDLKDAVQRGIDISNETGEPFLWLTDQNCFASQVSAAVIEKEFGITEEDCRKHGVKCDVTTGSKIG